MRAQKAEIRPSHRLAHAGTPLLLTLAKNLNNSPSLAIAYAILGIGNMDPNIDTVRAAKAPETAQGSFEVQL